jgi:hypothetical protein
MELCRNLRWKSITRDLDDPDEVLAAFARNQVPYTCLETCRSWGPDDELAAPELCHSQRGCFRPSALTLRLRKREAPE